MIILPDKPPQPEILIYQTDDGCTRIQVRLEDETVWLTQRLVAELHEQMSEAATQVVAISNNLE